MDKQREITESKREAEWQQEQQLVSRICELGAQAVADKIPHLYQAFERVPKPTLVCGDDRVIGVAGNVTMLGEGIFADFDQVADLILDHGIQEICWHDDCGAWNIYSTLCGHHRPEINDNHANYCRALAEVTGIEFSHVGIDAMLGEPGFHPAVAIYLNGETFFNFSKIRGLLPTGFVLSFGFAGVENGLFELETALDIAFDHHHGFGERFTATLPLLIVPIGNPTKPALSVTAITKSVKPILAVFGDRVRISGFTAPIS